MAAVSALFGILMLAVTAPDEPAAVFSYAFGGFCLAIAMTCVAPGRIGQFFGSLVALTVVVLGLWYPASMLHTGVFWSASRTEPSFLNAVGFLVVFAPPSAAYLWHARFGFPRTQESLAQGTEDHSTGNG
jgi:hypothetical protein